MKKNALALSVAAAFGTRVPDHRTFPALPKTPFPTLSWEETKKLYIIDGLQPINSFAASYSLDEILQKKLEPRTHQGDSNGQSET